MSEESKMAKVLNPINNKRRWSQATIRGSSIKIEIETARTCSRDADNTTYLYMLLGIRVCLKKIK